MKRSSPPVLREGAARLMRYQRAAWPSKVTPLLTTTVRMAQTGRAVLGRRSAAQQSRPLGRLRAHLGKPAGTGAPSDQQVDCLEGRPVTFPPEPKRVWPAALQKVLKRVPSSLRAHSAAVG